MQNTHTKPTTIALPISTEQNQATDLIEREKESKPPNPQHCRSEREGEGLQMWYPFASQKMKKIKTYGK